MSYLGELLGTLVERPAKLVMGSKKGRIEALSLDLLKQWTEVSSLQTATDIFSCYENLDQDGRLSFFKFLTNEMDLDADQIIKAGQAYAEDNSPENYKRLAKANEPKRYEFLRRLNQPPGATASIVRMRADLLGLIPDNPELARLDADMQLMLRSWFNRGFLVLQHITWDSPASILEKIIAYEAVHEIETWDELRRRLHPADRRCFAFFHPAMPEEPLIFVEVALSKGVPSSIQGVLADNRDVLKVEAADTAVFYSISNCQKGLAGISFGNSLIKQVVRDLVIEIPGISNFVTLSPVPSLNKWLKSEELDPSALADTDLRKLASFYLTEVKGRNDAPRDPVARFHLSNGAQLKAVHAGANLSDNGIAQSSGVMVNYAYELGKINDNLNTYSKGTKVPASNPVRTLARQAKSLVDRSTGS